jgi:hypothetical protein
VVTKNFFAPFWNANMGNDAPRTEYGIAEEAVPGKLGRPPSVALTYATNLIQLQKQLEGVAKQISESVAPKTGTEQ